MNPVTIVFGLQRVLSSVLALAVWSAAAFGAGYLTKGHRDSLADAKIEAKQETAATTVKAAATTIDNQALVRLKSALATANSRAETLEQIIKDQANATPPAVTCRLPDGLRDQINADIAPSTP
jgi:hypothetical protein